MFAESIDVEQLLTLSHSKIRTTQPIQVVHISHFKLFFRQYHAFVLAFIEPAHGKTSIAVQTTTNHTHLHGGTVNILKEIYIAEDSFRRENGSKPKHIQINEQGGELIKEALYPNLRLPKNIIIPKLDGIPLIIKPTQSQLWQFA